jgi:predicted TIM-barrel fold metal-dependent hydrolase
VEDIYYRYSSCFDDDDGWKACRCRAHDYLLKIAREHHGIYPYYFVWNDFVVEDLDRPFFGIKWHHHDGEPPYHYHDPKCTEMVDAICTRKLPIVLEETFEQTLKFIEQVAGRTAVIIPHLGLLNGGFDTLLDAGIWKDDNIFADTALAGRREISIFLETYGADRLIFGSDYPFGMPGPQLNRLTRMGIGKNDLEKICSGNILGLLPHKTVTNAPSRC